MQPLAIDLFCGLGGWTEGLLAEGWRVIGFDIERHVYGEHRYPAQLVLQDVCTLHGSQFKDARLIVASSPCQEFSYRAMPWKRAKALPPPELGMHLFAQAARIQREAIEASGRLIPMVQENVRGAQKYVGRAQWHYGSYYLWGDVPALMPMTAKAIKVATMGAGWYPPDHPKHVPGPAFNTHAERGLKGVPHRPKGHWTNPNENEGIKNGGGSWFGIGSPGQKVTNQNPVDQYVASTGVGKNAGTKGYAARLGESTISRRHGSKSNARKAASAAIAKIPFPLAQWIARAWWPTDVHILEAIGGGTA